MYWWCGRGECDGGVGGVSVMVVWVGGVSAMVVWKGCVMVVWEG